MNFLILIPQYITWHYTRGISDYVKNYKNFLLFIFDFFSIKILFKTLFTPFQRLKEKYKGGLNLGDLFEVIVTNILMRLVGFIVRSFLIMLGLVCFLVFLSLGIGFFIAWLFLPVILIGLLVYSIKIFFTLS